MASLSSHRCPVSCKQGKSLQQGRDTVWLWGVSVARAGSLTGWWQNIYKRALEESGFLLPKIGGGLLPQPWPWPWPRDNNAPWFKVTSCRGRENSATRWDDAALKMEMAPLKQRICLNDPSMGTLKLRTSLSATSVAIAHHRKHV